MPDEKSHISKGIETFKGAFELLREICIVVAILLLLLWPSTMKQILEKAGFTKAEIGPLTWESSSPTPRPVRTLAPSRVSPVTYRVAVVNASSVLTDDQVKIGTDALQTQVHRDFAPVWGIDAELTGVPHGTQPGSGAWQLVILDNSDQAGALGYHDVTTEALPLSKVFAATTQKYGGHWTLTASHELLNMLVNPRINLTVFVQGKTNEATLYAYEVTDACQAEEYGYDIDSIRVSDFVFPSWFDSSRKPGSTQQFDYSKHISKPFELLRGGYISVFDVKSNTGWRQLIGPTGGNVQ